MALKFGVAFGCEMYVISRRWGPAIRRRLPGHCDGSHRHSAPDPAQHGGWACIWLCRNGATERSRPFAAAPGLERLTGLAVGRVARAGAHLGYRAGFEKAHIQCSKAPFEASQPLSPAPPVCKNTRSRAKESEALAMGAKVGLRAWQPRARAFRPRPAIAPRTSRRHASLAAPAGFCARPRPSSPLRMRITHSSPLFDPTLFWNRRPSSRLMRRRP